MHVAWFGDDAVLAASQGPGRECAGVEERIAHVLVDDAAAVLEELSQRNSADERMELGPVLRNRRVERQDAVLDEARRDRGTVVRGNRARRPDAVRRER